MHGPEPAFEPYRIASVEPLGFTTREERAAALREAGGELSRVPADKVLIDLLTEPGACAAAEPWDAPARVLPEGGESQLALFKAAGGPGKIFLSNALSGAARESVAAAGSQARELPVPDVLAPSLAAPFKGDIDPRALEASARELGSRAAMIVMTLTNGALGGQPASLANVRAAREISRHYGIPLYLDASRLAENAWLIKRREHGHALRPAVDIARELFSYCDGAWAGAVACDGGLADARDERRLSYRPAAVERFAESLRRAGVPLVEPAGGHSAIVDAGRVPGSARALAAEIYLEGGVRAAVSSAPGREWVQLNVPRRAYTESHLAHAASVVAAAFKAKVAA
jgi:tryptophanase